jgi:hypothetical protein
MRRRTIAHHRRPVLVVALLACTLAAGCAGSTAHVRRELMRTVAWVHRARFPVAPVALPGGGLLYGERLTGRIRRVDRDGRLASTPIATVPAVGGPADQRGLVGLARTDTARIFATWTGADGRLRVAEVTPADVRPPRIVWTGPVSAVRANGGTLAFDGRGRLLVGIGDLLGDRTLAADPGVPNRKVLALDPDGDGDQVPTILSTGWNNPYALVVTRAGVPWVADNAGGRAPERIGRADRPATEAGPLRRDGETLAPAGLVELSPGRFGVCGYISGRLDEYRIRDGAATRTGRVVTATCRLGATVLHDGRLVTLGLHTVRRSTTRVAGAR